MKVTESFRDAEALADFANLDPTDSASVAYFKNNYGDFAPSAWWDYPYRIGGTRVLRYEDVITITESDPNFQSKMENKVVRQWQHAQEQIQRVWKAEFELTNVAEVSDLLKLVFDVDRPGLLWNSSQVLLPNGTIYELNTRLYSFHKALLYLHEHPRQAKICEECGKYFVHVHGKRTLCLFPDSRSETCSQKRINKNRLKWWYKKGDKRRKAKQKGERYAAKKKTTR